MGVIINNPATATSGIGRNYLKNPAFSVIQGSASGTVSSSGPTGSLGYPGETEWAIIVTGNVQYAFSTANQSLTLTGAANVEVIRVLQRIESRDASLLASKQVTLSVELSNSLLTTVTWELFHPTTIADVHGTISSPTQTLIASGTWTVTSTLTRYSTTVTLPAEVSNGLEVRFRVGAQTSGTWVITKPKLEESGSATAFACDDYIVELAKCQRYYFAASLLIGNSANYITSYIFPSPMFATPVRTGGGAGYTQLLLNNIAFAAAQNGAAVQAMTFSAHIP